MIAMQQYQGSSDFQKTQELCSHATKAANTPEHIVFISGWNLGCFPLSRSLYAESLPGVALFAVHYENIGVARGQTHVFSLPILWRPWLTCELSLLLHNGWATGALTCKVDVVNRCF